MTLLFINISPRTEYSLAVPGGGGGGGGSRQEWHLSAPDVLSKVVSLNGKPLLLQGPGETDARSECKRVLEYLSRYGIR